MKCRILSNFKGAIIILLFLSCSNLILAGYQKQNDTICYFNTDSIWGYLNSDNEKDLIIVDSDNELPANMRIRIYFNLNSGQYELKIDRQFVAAGAVEPPVFSVDENHNIHMEYSYFKSAEEYIYKYFELYDDWFLFEAVTIYDEEEAKKPNCRPWPLSETQAIGIQEGWVSIINNNEKDSVKLVFENQHQLFLNEFKTKDFHQIHNCSQDEIMDYIRYLDINNSTVQRFNDIAYFLIEAKNYELSLIILEFIIYEYSTRTVAYINLGDAYWGLKQNDQAKEAYQSYIELMTLSGKESKIPQRVWDRAK